MTEQPGPSKYASETPAVIARRLGLLAYLKADTTNVKHMTLTWTRLLDLAVARYHDVNATVRIKKWSDGGSDDAAV